MVTYILLNSKTKFFTSPEKIVPGQGYWLGDTWEDYLQGRLVILSDEQVAFHEAHPTATPKEVWDMELVPAKEPTLAEVKANKIAEIQNYDNSSAVNSFLLNGEEAWLTPDERVRYSNSLNSYKRLGLEEAAFVINGKAFTVSVEVAELLLAKISVYADACFMITTQHITEVNTLNSIDEVNEFDITAGYPEKLTFEI